MNFIVNKLPKAVLHEHVEGTITAKMAKFLAEKNNIILPDNFILTN